MKTMLNTTEITRLHTEFSNTSDGVRIGEITDRAEMIGLPRKSAYKTVKNIFITGAKRGLYHFPAANVTVESAPAPAAAPAHAPAETFKNAMSVSSISDDEIYIPAIDPTFVKWGEYKTVFKALESKLFFPLYISGMSGNGKTFMVEQACAKAKREYVRVQISPETDEDDLIGGFRLINGETVFQKGPVMKAMERGCVLLIDEIDRATNKIMCLQGVLEGNPVLLKKTGEVIVPAPGFTVIATANTKGRGSDDGRYSAATIIDDAFLERFVATIDQTYPSPSIETKILAKHAIKYDVDDKTFIEKLIAWASVIRKTFDEDAIDDVISTRRLCHIVKCFSIFSDRIKAIELCVNRFDEETRSAFLDLYTKIDESTPTMEELMNGTDTTADEEEMYP